MADKLFPTIKRGVDEVKNNPQLWWTIITALVIVGSFYLVTSNFIKIAEDAQDKLVNVRIGSIQDALSEFIPPQLGNQFTLQQGIKNIAIKNETIVDFRVIRFNNDQNRVIASLKQTEINTIYQDDSFLISQAKTDPSNSFTIETRDVTGERLFKTARAITQDNVVIGIILTTQTLSEADRIISQNIQTSILIFIVVIIIVMILFLRHAKIIDYVSLYNRLKEVDNMKDDFVALASHELKAPVAIIRGYSQFLLEDPELSSKSKEDAKKIDITAQQLANLITDMLDVSKIEQGRMEYEFKNIDPITVCNDVVERFSGRAKEKDIDLKLSANASGFINVDQDKFRQVITNLVSNSIKYTPRGDVRVNVERKDKDVIITVSDSGIGMTQEELSNLFQKFYRIKNKETADVRGTGLGLWITKRMVEDMGGNISVESIKDVGTHFVVKFPAK